MNSIELIKMKLTFKSIIFFIHYITIVIHIMLSLSMTKCIMGMGLGAPLGVGGENNEWGRGWVRIMSRYLSNLL